MATTIAKRNGTLTIRETVRRMHKRAITGQTSDTYNIKYVARRIGKNVSQTRQIVKYLCENMNVGVELEANNFVFVR